MNRRKHISWKTRCAAAVLDAQLVRERFGLDPGRWYRDAKQLTEDQFLSLFQWDHNILFSSEDPLCDEYWNLTPMLIQAHRAKTKVDAKVIAKGRRIRAKLRSPDELYMNVEPARRKLRSRGFDKRLRKKMSGEVVPR